MGAHDIMEKSERDGVEFNPIKLTFFSAFSFLCFVNIQLVDLLVLLLGVFEASEDFQGSKSFILAYQRILHKFLFLNFTPSRGMCVYLCVWMEKKMEKCRSCNIGARAGRWECEIDIKTIRRMRE